MPVKTMQHCPYLRVCFHRRLQRHAYSRPRVAAGGHHTDTSSCWWWYRPVHHLRCHHMSRLPVGSLARHPAIGLLNAPARCKASRHRQAGKHTAGVGVVGGRVIGLLELLLLGRAGALQAGIAGTTSAPRSFRAVVLVLETTRVPAWPRLPRVSSRRIAPC